MLAERCQRAYETTASAVYTNDPASVVEGRVAIAEVRQLRERLQEHPAARPRPGGVVGGDGVPEGVAC